MPCSDFSKACAVPWKEVFSVAGACSSTMPLRTSVIASESETPGRRSKEKVTEGSWPRWVTDSGPTP